jgi:hypothetical protein
MTSSPPRSTEQRKIDTLAILQVPRTDVWVATASRGDSAASAAQAHLVPLSMAWVGERVVIALERSSRTAQNLAETGQARLAVGPTRDLVMIDVVVDTIVAVADVDLALVDAYTAQTQWDPRSESAPLVCITLRPLRIQAWRQANELTGRTLMRNGAWLA